MGKNTKQFKVLLVVFKYWNRKEVKPIYKERKTIIEEFDSISARRVVVANQKLFINKKEGFVGFSLKKDEYISKCSSIKLFFK